MPSDTISGLRAEINAALAVLIPQIRGFDDLVLVSLSQPVLDVVNRERLDHDRRRDLLNTVLGLLDQLQAAIDELVKDGYPNMDKLPVPADIFAELQQQLADFQAAFGEF